MKLSYAASSVHLGAFAIAVSAAACDGLTDRGTLPPTGQIVLGVATDAWLPRGPSEPPDPIGRASLFERLRFEFFAPGESVPCPDCTRDFGIDHQTSNDGKLSVGFVPTPGTAGYRARVRLYHSGASESAAEPRIASTIETVVALPPIPAEGITRLHVVLRTDDLARPKGTLAAPLAVLDGPPPSGLAGTWRAELRRDCGAPARAGEACVPGGAFWMGDPSFATPFERLVGVSPFYIDVREVSVGQVRGSGLAFLDVAALKADPYLYSPDATKNIHYCTYTQNAADKEDLPVNCVSPTLAAKFCESRGGTLPSEAQYEFAAGARRDATYPWGEGTPGCEDAVFARTYETDKPRELRACAALGIGVAKAGSGRLDRVAMPDGNEVVDLGGNLTEWIRDAWQKSDESCFATPFAIDPVCTQPSVVEPGRLSVRGCAWTELGASLLRGAVRSSTGAAAPQNPRVGFRCVRAVDDSAGRGGTP
ncbi:MAG: SUMF1/EgtB/PvdO family nonheme iron enzyme [Deltaproteobacteria bacterium]|nr:SUMF1/EgtB/PvdO family nonheme iron enzyme [Deltaproteobacteria bacterium]